MNNDPQAGFVTASLTGSQLRQMGRLRDGDAARERARRVRSSVMGLVGSGGGVYVASAQIVGYEDRGGTTFFRIHVKTEGEQPSTWEVSRRYNQFDNLRKELGVVSHRVGSLFPHKTGMSACTGEQLTQRMQLLQSWLNGLITEFATGGDGRHSIVPINRTAKLQALHRFFGIELEGRLSSDAVLVGEVLAPAPVATAVAASAPPAFEVLSPTAPPLLPEQALETQAHNVATEQAPQSGSLANEYEREQEQLQEDLEAVRRFEAEEARREMERSEEEEARLREARQKEEQAAVEAEALRLKAEEEAEEQRARVQQEKEEQEAAAAAEEARLRAEREEEEERLKAEEEAAAALRAAAEEEARRKAEAEKSWLQKAVDLAQHAQDLEAAGQRQEALQTFRNCVELFVFVKKREKSARVQEMLQVRIDELSQRADRLWESLAGGMLEEGDAAVSTTIGAIPAAPSEPVLQEASAASTVPCAEATQEAVPS